jgi:hypothetical protein
MAWPAHIDFRNEYEVSKRKPKVNSQYKKKKV